MPYPDDALTDVLTGVQHAHHARQYLQAATDPNTPVEGAEIDALVGIGHALLALHDAVNHLTGQVDQSAGLLAAQTGRRA